MVSIISLVVIFFFSCLANRVYSISFSELGSNSADSSFLSHCKWSQHYKKKFSTYYVNLDRSSQRRSFMDVFLREYGFSFHRFKALSIDSDIYIPSDVEKAWNSYRAVSNTTLFPPSRLIPSDPLSSKSVVLSGIFGRRKSNRLKELGCTTSHLMAIRKAIFENETDSPFSLILEDDIVIPFEIDFDQLISSAPQNWGILQLFNSNEESMENNWNTYVRSGKLWNARYPKMAASYWSTCAYIINRDILRPIISNLVKYHESNGWWDVKVLAATSNPCGPPFSECCLNGKIFQPQYGVCIESPRGFQADSFLYAMTQTYVLGVPLITSSLGGNQSTFHQSHVEIFHQKAFLRQRRYINQMISGEVALPSFVSLSCGRELIPMEIPVNHRSECIFTNRTSPYLSKQNEKSSNFYDSTTQSNLQSKTKESDEFVEVIWIRPNRTILLNESRADELELKMASRLKHAGYSFQFVHPVQVEDIYLPNDIATHWTTRDCKISSQEAPEKFHQWVSKVTSMHPRYKHRNNTAATDQVLFYLSGLCGRGKGRNSISDLAEILTHLLAIYRAVFHSQSPSPWALILQDEVAFPFDIQFRQFFEQAFSQIHPATFTDSKTFSGNSSALTPWSMIFLNSYNRRILEKNWIRYVRNPQQFVIDFNRRLFDYWSMRNYMIYRPFWRSFLPKIFRIKASTTSSTSSTSMEFLTLFEAKLISSLQRNCIPSSCCPTSSEVPAICIDSPRGLLVDSWLSSIGRPLISNLPFFYSQYPLPPLSVDDLILLNLSDPLPYQDLTDNAYLQRTYIQEMHQGIVNGPSFLRPACKSFLKQITW